jgi:uncharacterized protein (DUF1330 family)
MAKGYWIARVDVHDPEAYRKAAAANAEVFAKYGARFLVRGGPHKVVEGTSRQRNVVIEFPNYQAALDCYQSPEFAPVKAARAKAVNGDLVIIEGYDGPQPGD